MSAASAPIASERVLQTCDLWKYYGDRPVVCGLNFELRSGEILGLLGANGAGKTTTVGMLYGRVIPSRGFVQVGHYPVQRHGAQARRLMGIVTQEDTLDPDFNVLDNLIYFAHHYRIRGRTAHLRAIECLEQVGLSQKAGDRIDQLSGGMKRRLMLARSLLNQPRLIFLDEPTTGLDPHARQDFWRLISQLKQQGCAVVLTTHYMDEAQRLSDRLLLMDQGKVIDEGTPTALIERVVGSEMMEIVGIPEAAIAPIAQRYQTWFRPFGEGFLLNWPQRDGENLWAECASLHPSQMSRRRANLEDVFLRLTGSGLD